MRYLFFDIECCDGEHICEFGYIVTNEDFSIIERKMFTINPDKPFNLTGRPHQRDLQLCFPESVYYNSPIFTEYYQVIKDLIENPNQIVVGHSIGNDAKFIRKACKRYKLNPINFKFADSQKIYSEFTADKRRVSLEKAEELLSLPKPEYLHKSDDDALLTVQLVEKMCSTLEMTLQEVIELCPLACGSSNNFNITYNGDSIDEQIELLLRNPNALSIKKRKLCLEKFIDSVHPIGEIVQSKLHGKKLCLSYQYEKEHVVETLRIIQLLANHGCEYNIKVSENDYYVPTESELGSEQIDRHTRYYAAQNKGDGRNVEILTLYELYSILGVTEGSLHSVELSKVIAARKKTKKQVNKNYSTGKPINTLGDILKSKGIDLKKFQQ